jgi:ribose-phosphate pyrophosphokinase
LVVVNPHSNAPEGMCGEPVEMLTAIPVLAQAIGSLAAPHAVVVAPDQGAANLAERYASLFGRPVAVVRKTRVSGTTVMAEELVGDVEGRSVIVIDDMISTDRIIEGAVHVLLQHSVINPSS